MIDDTLHRQSPPGIRWTTNNFAEALPDVPTPLTWGIWEHAITSAAFDVFRRFGAFSSAHVARLRAENYPVVGLFYGHVAGNIDFMSQGVARLPGFDPGAFEHQLFALDPDDSPTQRTRRRWPAVALRAPLAVTSAGRRVTRERAATDSWWRGVTRAPIAPEAARAILAESRERFARMLAAHSMQSQLAQGLFDAIATTARDAGHAGLERQLVTGYGGVEEAVLAADLWAVSRDRLPLEVFLERHGFHGPNEGELSSRAWREDPTPVEAAAAAFAGEPDHRSPEALAARQVAERQHAEDRLLGAVARRRRPAVRAMLALARRWVPRREIGKAGFLQAIDGGRAAARTLGASMTRAGHLRAPDDVFFVTFDELMAPDLPNDVDARIDRRRATRTEYERVTLPAVWTGDPEPTAGSRSAETTMGVDEVVSGVPVSAGRVIARARVVRDAEACASPVGPDEILVTRTTDPSWVSMFLTAAGLVIDVGGPMSHGAIVARELGVPCIINTRDGTLRIPDGARIELDGDAGTVRRLD